MLRVPVRNGKLEVSLLGDGEPVLVIPTAMNPYELAPLAHVLAGTGRYHVVQYRRRGSGGSSPARVPASIAGEAEDAADLLRALGVDRAHVIGASYSSAIALALAITHPARVHTLSIHEPPPTFVPSRTEFRAALRALLAQRDRDGAGATIEAFERGLDGPDWRERLEQLAPGSVRAIDREADLFFDHDIPALLGWEFTAEQARTIDCPVLSLGGSASGPWFAEVHRVLADWLPAARTIVLEGGDHTLMLNRAPEVAAIIEEFLADHPM